METIADMYNVSRQAVSARLKRYRKALTGQDSPAKPATQRALEWRAQHGSDPDLRRHHFVTQTLQRVCRTINTTLRRLPIKPTELAARIDPRKKGRSRLPWISRYLRSGGDDLNVSSLATLAWALGMELEIKLTPMGDLATKGGAASLPADASSASPQSPGPGAVEPPPAAPSPVTSLINAMAERPREADFPPLNPSTWRDEAD